MDNSHLPWAEAPQWQRESAVKGVEFAIANGFPNAEAQHEAWLKDKEAAGWVYGPVKDANKKEHPSMRPYAELPEVERNKDKIFRSTIMQSLGVKDQPVGISTLQEFGPGQGPAILAGIGAEKITIETPNEEAKT